MKKYNITLPGGDFFPAFFGDIVSEILEFNFYFIKVR